MLKTKYKTKISRLDKNNSHFIALAKNSNKLKLKDFGACLDIAKLEFPNQEIAIHIEFGPIID